MGFLHYTKQNITVIDLHVCATELSTTPDIEVLILFSDCTWTPSLAVMMLTMAFVCIVCTSRALSKGSDKGKKWEKVSCLVCH